MADKFAHKREQMNSRQMDAVQQSRNEIASALNQCPFVRGNLVSATFTTTYKVVTHGLGKPAAFFVIRQDYSKAEPLAVLVEAADQTGLDPNRQIRIASAAPSTVDLWFYPRASKSIGSTGQST